MKYLVAALLGLSAIFHPAMGLEQPAVPFSTKERWIVDNNGDRFKLRCVNWAGHMEVRIPEGLHKQPVEHIAEFIASSGYNCVRLTYSIDMALDQTMAVSDAFPNGAKNAGVDVDALNDMYTAAVSLNPWLSNSTVINVFDYVQSALWDRGVVTVLDNHVSRAQWCCDLDDGNGWWADAPGAWPANGKYFITDDWINGLGAMAAWAHGKPGIVGMSLRNELREQITELPKAVDTWNDRMPRGARVVHGNNSDVLIAVGGTKGGTDLSFLRGTTMDNGDWAGKNVWEAHSYSYTVTQPSLGSCDVEKTELGGWFGFVLDSTQPSNGPFWLSEFGVGMTGGDHSGLNDQDSAYLSCLSDYMTNNDADWAHWAVQGSYYIRQGNIDVEETWGALDVDWNTWRNTAFPPMLGQMWNMTQGP